VLDLYNVNFLKNIFSFFIDKKPRVTVFLCMFFFLSYFYSPILFHPSSYLFGETGDAIKNYFCYEWHVQNDKSFINYTGTNYPFGEQHVFTDGNPLLSNLVKALPFLKNYSIAIFNLSLLFSIIVTALLLFSILKEFKVSNWFSILSSIGIAILSPQTLRLTGHFTLSYSFFIPLVIYLLILFETREQKNKYTLLICFVLLCSFFIHPYLGMILTSMVFLYHFIKLFLFYKLIVQIIFPFFLQSIFPVLFYFIFLKVTDWHTNRISNPYGFFFYIARIESVLVSSLPPFRHMLSQIIKIREQNWEGLAYIGISSLFALLYLPFLVFSKRKKLIVFLGDNKNMVVLLMLTLASVFLLIFSMGYPFKWGGEWILDAVPLIKQFRSPGRFAWVFYFMATISSTIILSKYFLKGINLQIRNTLISAILILFSVEGLPFHKQITHNGFAKNCFDKSNLNEEMKQICVAINKVKPQAIIPLPFFHMGTDYFCFNGTEKIKTASFFVAFNTGTPILGNCTDRTSLDEAKALVQLFSSSLFRKELSQFVKSKAPFCILYSKELLEEEEQNILLKGRIIIETQNYLVEEILPAELFANDIAKYKNYYAKNRNNFQFYDGFNFLDKSVFLKSLSFDNLPDKLFSGPIKWEQTLLHIPPNSLEKDSVYELSFWLNLKNGSELAEDIVAKEVSAKGETIQVLAEKKCCQMANVANNKLLVILNFKTSSPENKIKIFLKGNPENNDFFELDNLLIHKKSVNMFKMYYLPDHKDSVLILNNIQLR